MYDTSIKVLAGLSGALWVLVLAFPYVQEWLEGRAANVDVTASHASLWGDMLALALLVTFILLALVILHALIARYHTTR